MHWKRGLIVVALLLALAGCSGDNQSPLAPYLVSSWRSMQVNPPELALWGSSGSDVFAVGMGGTVLHYDGSVWSAMTCRTSTSLYGIWGSSGNDVFAAPLGSMILHYGP